MSTEADDGADPVGERGPRRLVVLDGEHELTGVVRPEESWAVAARRTCASLTAEPEALDLSGEVLAFVLDHETRVALRAMTAADLDDAVAWRSEEGVRRWWSPDGPEDADRLRATLGERIDGRSPTRMWVVEVAGRAVGFCQDYRLGDHPDDLERAAGAAWAGPGSTPGPDTIGLDYAIGVARWRGRGLGARVLWAWMQRTHHRFPQAESFLAAPDHRNAASLRALAKAGFAPGPRFEEPVAGGGTRTVVGCRLDVATVLAARARSH